MSTDWYYTVSEENLFYASKKELYTPRILRTAEISKRYKEPNDFILD